MGIQRPSSYRRFSTTDTRKTVQSDKITRINDLLDGIIGYYVDGNEFNKLTYLSDIKFAIASAIKAKGKSVDSDPFMNYANKIAELENNDNSIAKINRFIGVCFTTESIKKVTLTEVTE